MQHNVRMASIADIARMSSIVNVNGLSTKPSMVSDHDANCSGFGVRPYEVTYKSLMGVTGISVNGGERVAVGCGMLVGVGVGGGRVLPGTYTVGATRSGRQPASKLATVTEDRRRNRRRFMVTTVLHEHDGSLIVPINGIWIDEKLQNNRPS